MSTSPRVRRARALWATALTAALAAVGTYRWVTAADHEDSPLLGEDQAADIADVYSFRSPHHPDHLVLVMTLSDAIPPGQIRLGRSIFDPHVLYQFKIDNTGDAVEDLVLQAFVTGDPKHQVLHLRGPVAPKVAGTEAEILGGPAMTVRVSTGPKPIVAQRHGVTLFAGVRDDPFFFDLGQFRAILAGQATSFNDPGTDSFAGLNTYAIVVELPLAMLGGGAAGMSVWGTTSRS
jgi:hypothetical protein